MLKLYFVTPERTVFEGDIISVVAPGMDGYFQVLTNHASMLAGLQPGQVTLTFPDGQKQYFATTIGFLDVDHNQVRLLVDSAETAAEIDIPRARAALKRATKLVDSTDQEIDIQRAKESLQRAEARLKVAHQEEQRLSQSR